MPDCLQPVLPPQRAWPLFDGAATRTIEQAALAATAPHALMARAGLAVARLLLATQPHARSVLAFAGPGNNGGDAVVAASALRRCGLAVQLVLLGDPQRLPADAAWALREAQAQAVPMCRDLPATIDADVMLDGLLGLGASRAPDGVIAAAITLLNRSAAPVIAIDLPSGLDADRGTVLGAAAVHAQHTLALLTLKAGLFTAAGRDHAGRVWTDSLGVVLPDSLATLVGPATMASAMAPHASHKGAFGDVTVLGGAPGMAGAAALAARAALAAGAGRVYLGTLDPAAPAFDPVRPELMHRSLPGLLTPPWLSLQTVACGCGGGEAVRAVLPPVLAHAARLVLDADALNVVAAEPALQRALAARAARGLATVLTPHPLEAARLLGCSAAAVQADRSAAARRLAAELGCVVVLKGSGTLIATADGRWCINTSGNALLASAGTGDVLAGWLAGSWSRSSGPADGVVAAAVHRHGLAADRMALQDQVPPCLLAGDLIAAMAAAPG